MSEPDRTPKSRLLSVCDPGDENRKAPGQYHQDEYQIENVADRGLNGKAPPPVQRRDAGNLWAGTGTDV
jgi:hypothetical protein